ncbi:sigma-70 family RNA polymerase sigma factor [Aureimonas flava]|uniref:Sigma-70 family RNA polymerase sigma factor n=1 Tax=Aureimonas flava TaxID=2320271 RepID=A0A3A1WMG7_9HYPH|nr:sigma-70 family RNA polymerase sigma factor [Aureimonas flava]RIX97300.1 sigma-70 family RNA polymerase sigma factor [Aureimonas flava]
MRQGPLPEDARQRLVSALGRVAAGEREALRAVYDLTSAKLFGVALRILDDEAEAEDVLQDVYVTVWNRAGGFDPARASPITWLCTLARNRAIDRLRALRPHRSRADLDAADRVADETPGALARLEAEGEARRLAACLDGLEPRAREAIHAAFFGGRTYEDLARGAGVPLGTMKSVIRRGLIRLRGCLEA